MKLPRIFRLCLLTVVATLWACQPDPASRFSRAEAYLTEHNYRGAALELRGVLQAEPANVRARRMLGQAELQLGDVADARAELEKAIRAGDDDPATWRMLGEALLELGEVTAASEKIIPALTDDAGDAESLLVAGNIYLAYGDLDAAMGAFQAAVDAAATEVTTSAAALAGQAKTAAAAGDFAPARRYLEQALQISDDDWRVWRAKGDVEIAAGDADAAGPAYERAVALQNLSTAGQERYTTRIRWAAALLRNSELDSSRSVLDDIDGQFGVRPISYLLRGRIAFEAGRADDAQRYLQEYLSQSPDDPRGLVALGMVNLAQQSLRQAEMYLERAARSKQGGDTARRMLAETQLRLGKPVQALETLQTLEAHGADDAATLAMIGRAQIGAGATDLGLAYLDRSSAMGSADPALNLSIASSYLAAGDAARAVEFLESLPESGSDYQRDSLLMLAYMRQGEQEKALGVGRSLVAGHPDDPTAYVISGEFQQLAGDTAAARQSYQRALALDPQNTAGKFGLARQALAAGDDQEAANYLRDVLDREPSFVPALAAYIQAMQDEPGYGDLQARLERSVEAAPNGYDQRILLVRYLLATNDLAAAAGLLQGTAELFPGDAAVEHLEGLLQAREGQFAASMDKLENAARNAPDNARFQFDLARTALQAGDHLLAGEAARRYRELDPDDPKGLALLVAAQVAGGAATDARDEVLTFERKHPDIQGVQQLAGDVAFAMGNLEEAHRRYQAAATERWDREAAMRLYQVGRAMARDDAIRPLQRWLADNPDDAGVRMMLGQAVEQGGDLAAAATNYEQALRSDSDNVVALNNLAWIYTETGDPRAVETAEKAYKLQPDSASVTDTLGWALVRGGQVETGSELLRQAAASAPEDRNIRYHLAYALAKLGQNDEAKSIVGELLASGTQFASRKDAEELAAAL